MGRKALDYDQSLDAFKLTYGFKEDFDVYDEATVNAASQSDDDRWTTLASDSGSVAVGDTQYGVAVLSPSDGTVADNDEVYLYTTNELLKFVANKPIEVGFYAKRVSVADDDAVFLGFLNAWAADTIADTDGGMPSNYYGAGFHKLDGGNWVCECSMGTTQKTNTSDEVPDGDWHWFEVRVNHAEDAGDFIEVTYFIDGQQTRDSTTLDPIKHRIEISSATEMAVGCGIKLGAATNHDKVHVDAVYCRQTR